MKGEIKYNIKLEADTGSGERALNGVAQAGTAVAQVYNGNVVGAFVSAKNALNSFKAAMVANPFGAVLRTLTSIASVVASTMWRNYQKGIEDTKKAIEDLIDARKRLLGLDRPLIERAKDEARSLSEKGDVASLDRQAAKASDLAKHYSALAAAKDKEAAQLEAGIGRGATKAMVLEARRQAEAHRTAATEMELIARLYLESAAVTADALKKKEDAARAEADALKKKEDAARAEAEAEAKRVELMRRANADALADAEARTDLTKSLQGKSQEEQIRLKIEDAQRRYSVAVQRSQRGDTSEDQATAFKIEAESITAELAVLQESLEAIRRDQADRLNAVEIAEAAYDFSKLSPEKQLAGINDRMKEIMGKSGWEKDPAARAELLDLRKKRDDIEDAKKKKGEEKKAPKPAPTESAADWSDVFAAGRARRRVDDVIRMRGSRAGGFMDEDGVRRMTGSLAGGFSGRLRPSAFARSAAEIEAKRRGIADSARQVTATTGEEQPVELKGQAVDYLRIIAGALGKEA